MSSQHGRTVSLQMRRQESFDLQGARRLLDEDHRGLEKVREIQILGHFMVAYNVLMVMKNY